MSAAEASDEEEGEELPELQLDTNLGTVMLSDAKPCPDTGVNIGPTHDFGFKVSCAPPACPHKPLPATSTV